jgi:hypothetical protein
MIMDFEPTKSFCYRFARYEVLDEIAKELEARSGAPFKLLDLSKRIIEKHLTPSQLAMQTPPNESGRTDSVYAELKFFVALHAKRLANSPFVWLGGGGMFRLKSDADIQQEMDETVLEAEDDEEDEDAIQFDGWVYAFSFPILVSTDAMFPIKIGKTTKAVDERVAYQCRGSATFDNPVILGKWQVNRVGAVESAVHATLKSRGKWRENVPGTEWFNTTVAEIEQIVKFITQSGPLV